MRLKNTLLLIMLFIGFSFFLLCSPISNAQDAIISIKAVNVQLLEIRPPIGATTIREYRISVVLQNTGNAASENISVQFKEPQTGLSGNLSLQPESYSLLPNEEKTFVFENWPTSLSGDIPIHISFGPSSPNVVVTANNSGSYVYTLHIDNGQKSTSTPGFEAMIVPLALLLFLLKKQRNN